MDVHVVARTGQKIPVAQMIADAALVAALPLSVSSDPTAPGLPQLRQLLLLLLNEVPNPTSDATASILRQVHGLVEEVRQVVG